MHVEIRGELPKARPQSLHKERPLPKRPFQSGPCPPRLDQRPVSSSDLAAGFRPFPVGSEEQKMPAMNAILRIPFLYTRLS